MERSKEAILRLLVLSDDEWGTLKLHCPNLIKQLRSTFPAEGSRTNLATSDICEVVRKTLAFYDGQKRPMDEGEVEILDTLEAALVAAEVDVGIASARPLGIGQRDEGGCRDA